MPESSLLAAAMTWPFLSEAILVLLCGVAAVWAHRWVARRVIEPELPAAPTAKRVGLRLLSSIVWPMAWVVSLSVIDLLQSQFRQPAGLIELAVPVLWFVALFQLALVLLALLLPNRPVIRALAALAAAISIVIWAADFFGRDAALMALANYPLLELGPAVISLKVIVKALFLFGTLFLVATQVTLLLQGRVLARTDIDPTLASAMLRFLKFFLFGIGVLVVLDTAGVNLSTLTIFGGALGIGMGFGLQNIANNLVSGVILLMDRSIKQGDVITVGDSYGWVVRLGARYVVVRTRDGVEKLIPNANLIASEITNWSHSDRAVRLHVKVGVSYNTDPFKVRDLLLHVADNQSRVLKYPQPNALFVNFSESSMDFELRLWINDPQEGVENVRSAIRFEIWKAFKEHNIEIPFPQRELHIKNAPALERRPPEFEETMPPSRKSEN